MRGRGNSCLPRLVHASNFRPGNRIRLIYSDCVARNRTRDAKGRTSCRARLPGEENQLGLIPVVEEISKYIPCDKPTYSPLPLPPDPGKDYPTRQSWHHNKLDVPRSNVNLLSSLLIGIRTIKILYYRTLNLSQLSHIVHLAKVLRHTL